MIQRHDIPSQMQRRMGLYHCEALVGRELLQTCFEIASYDPIAEDKLISLNGDNIPENSESVTLYFQRPPLQAS